MCKGPEAGIGFVCLRNRKKTRVAGGHWARLCMMWNKVCEAGRIPVLKDKQTLVESVDIYSKWNLKPLGEAGGTCKLATGTILLHNNQHWNLTRANVSCSHSLEYGLVGGCLILTGLGWTWLQVESQVQVHFTCLILRLLLQRPWLWEKCEGANTVVHHPSRGHGKAGQIQESPAFWKFGLYHFAFPKDLY